MSNITRRKVLKASAAVTGGLVFGGAGISEPVAAEHCATLEVSSTTVVVGESVTASVTYDYGPGSRELLENFAIAWGDGEQDGQVGPWSSGSVLTFSHTYSSTGYFTIFGRGYADNEHICPVGSVTIQVIEPAPGQSGDAPGQNMVPICHKGKTIYVTEDALARHAAHGDDVSGPCADS